MSHPTIHSNFSLEQWSNVCIMKTKSKIGVEWICLKLINE